MLCLRMKRESSGEQALLRTTPGGLVGFFHLCGHGLVVSPVVLVVDISQPAPSAHQAATPRAAEWRQLCGSSTPASTTAQGCRCSTSSRSTAHLPHGSRRMEANEGCAKSPSSSSAALDRLPRPGQQAAVCLRANPALHVARTPAAAVRDVDSLDR